MPTLASGAGLAIVSLPVIRPFIARWPALHVLSTAVLCIGFAALLVSPVAWALTPVLGRASPFVPMADPRIMSDLESGRFSPPGLHVDKRLVAFLQTNRRGEKYLLATLTCDAAASLIVATGEPVMAIGGFLGTDPVLTADKFAQIVADEELRFVMLTGEGPRGGQTEIAAWIREHGKPVSMELWRERPAFVPPRYLPGFGRAPQGRGGPSQLYDCRPEAGLPVSGASPPASS